jgi:hypothetical protein
VEKLFNPLLLWYCLCWWCGMFVVKNEKYQLQRKEDIVFCKVLGILNNNNNNNWRLAMVIIF